MLARIGVRILLLYRKIRYGYAFRRILLTKGLFTIVDQDDFERLNKYNWQANVREGRSRYATRTIRRNGRVCHRQMHRIITNAPKEMMVDHINHDGLDNRKVNLRLATPQQNAWNRRCLRRCNGSKYMGVSWDKQNRKWRGRLFVDGKSRFLGYFEDEKDAAIAFDRAAKEHRGEFAFLNFPQK